MISRPRQFLGILMLLAGIGFAAALFRKEGRLVFLGERASGTVESVRVTSTPSRTTSVSRVQVHHGSSTNEWLTLAFKTREGKDASFRALATFHTEVKVGDTLPIVYLPGDPSVGSIDTTRQLWMPFFVGFTVMIVCLAGGALLMQRWT